MTHVYHVHTRCNVQICRQGPAGNVQKRKQLRGDACSAPLHVGAWAPVRAEKHGWDANTGPQFQGAVAFLPPALYLPVRQMLPRSLLQGRRFHFATDLTFDFRCLPSSRQSLDGAAAVYRCHPPASRTWACPHGRVVECSGRTAMHSACSEPHLMTL